MSMSNAPQQVEVKRRIYWEPTEEDMILLYDWLNELRNQLGDEARALQEEAYASYCEGGNTAK
jgi:hypothetical protein